MIKLKVEAVRINAGFANQEEFLDEVNKQLKRAGNNKQLSVKTYQNRLKNPSLWRIDEGNAIAEVTGVPIEMIEF